MHHALKEERDTAEQEWESSKKQNFSGEAKGVWTLRNTQAVQNVPEASALLIDKGIKTSHFAKVF